MAKPTDRWHPSKAQVATWAQNLWDDEAFAAVRDLVGRADHLFVPKWVSLVHRSRGAHSAWSAVAAFDKGKVVLSADYPSFDGPTFDDEPIRGELLVEVAVVFPFANLARAHERASSAWDRCLGSPPALVNDPPLRVYPNTKRWSRPGIAMLDLASGRDIEPRGVWVIARTAPAPIPETDAALPDTLRLAHDDFRKLLPLFAGVVDVVRGAIYSGRKAVDRAAVMGWCGEYAFAASNRKTAPPLRWITVLRNPFDFESDAGVVEVKTTTVEGEGRAHFTASELEECFTRGAGYSVVCVRVPEVTVDAAFVALSAARLGHVPAGQAMSPRHLEALLHLEVLTGLSRERVHAAYEELLPVLAALETLPPSAFHVVPHALVWLAPVAKELIGRGAGVNVVFDRI